MNHRILKLPEKAQHIAELFRDFDLTPLDEFSEMNVTKDAWGHSLPPYVPFIGCDYETYRILVYSTAQNLNEEDHAQILDEYRTRKEASIYRLYSTGNEEKNYQCLAIRPYEDGMLPAMVGLFIACKFGKFVYNLEKIHELLAVTNYYKYSLRKDPRRDLNPNNLIHEDNEKYWKFNDELCSVEISVLRPNFILSFKGRQISILHKQECRVIPINDPSWIKRGARGCLGEMGSWTKEVSEFDHKEIEKLIEGYLDQVAEPYGKSKRDATRVYFKKYAKQWISA